MCAEKNTDKKSNANGCSNGKENTIFSKSKQNFSIEVEGMKAVCPLGEVARKGCPDISSFDYPHLLIYSFSHPHLENLCSLCLRRGVSAGIFSKKRLKPNPKSPISNSRSPKEQYRPITSTP